MGSRGPSRTIRNFEIIVDSRSSYRLGRRGAVALPLTPQSGQVNQTSDAAMR
jgi:hypothetical protein